MSGTFKSLNRTAQPAAPSNSQMNEPTPTGSAVVDTIRKRMQQMKDELEHSQDDLQRYQIEREREKHAREQVCEAVVFHRHVEIGSACYFFSFSFSLRLFLG